MNWYEFNQQYLVASLARVRAALEHHASGEPAADESIEINADAQMSPPALQTLCARFGLSPFEREVLLLCAGVELDSKFATLCAAAQGDPQKTFPTFSLALAALPDPHWSALTPAAPLRYWRMIEIGAGQAITSSPLRIDERVLHYLAGASYLDERLAGLIEPVSEATELVPSQRALVERIVTTWSKALENSSLPIIQLIGDELVGKKEIALAVCSALGLQLRIVNANAVPTDGRELDGFIRLWEREALLSGGALLLDCDDLDSAEALRPHAVERLIESLRGALMIAARTRRNAPRRTMLTFDVYKPNAHEQRVLWEEALGESIVKLNGNLETLVSQFNLSAPVIHAASAQALSQESATDEFGTALWEACRVQARPRLEDLAQRIEPIATWSELVLPEAQLEILREVAKHVRQRHKVYERWGFAAKSSRGLGISALFAGASGTGKTMAAEVLANELRLDLYRIDLSSVVSKYIGETEKNLRRVFDAADEGGAILLFDEADALFGKRTEIKDSHDRYANIEVSYLLQRMEAYRGLAILTTNMQEALDKAFLRRIRFIIQFPFPDAAQRAEIWRRIFPTSTPTASLDLARLARLNVAGGNIRNIALNAAFLAADANEPVRMIHLLRAARSEYSKMEKPLTDAEIRDWV